MMRRTRRARWSTTGLLLVLGLTTFALAAPALAAWASSATGSATAASTSLAPPTGLAASCGLVSASIKLDWTASASAWADGYKVSRGTSSGNYTVFATTTAVTYTTPALGTGTYYFTVQATKQSWLSAGAAEVSKAIVVVVVPVCL